MSQPPSTDPRTIAATAADDLMTALGGRHDVAVVMGSGWAPAADANAAAAAAAWLHGANADRWPPGRPLTASALARAN